MQYTDYMNDYQARRERDIQLAKKYNQITEPVKVVEKEEHFGWIIAGIALAGIILLFAIFYI